jgi:putative NADH-flavin reductase
MHVAILGSTGLTGRELVSVCLEAGHHLHLLVRDAKKLTENVMTSTNVQLVTGDVSSQESIDRIVHASNVTMICVGSPDNRPTTVHRDAVRAVLEAMKTKPNGPKKIVFIASFLCHPKVDRPFIASRVVNFFLGEIFNDHQAAIALLKEAPDVEYSILEPPQILEAPKVGYNLNTEGSIKEGDPMVVTFRDLAEAMLEVAQDAKYNKTEIVIGSKHKFKKTKEMTARGRKLFGEELKRKLHIIK